MVIHSFDACRVSIIPRLYAFASTALLCAGILAFSPFAGMAAQASEWNSAVQIQNQDRSTMARGETAPRDGVRTRYGIGRRPLGRAPYVCTPSGFGRTASCQLRGHSNSAFN